MGKCRAKQTAKKPASSNSSKRRELRRRLRQYEESFLTLGDSLLRSDLKEACSAQKAVDEVALISYAWAKARHRNSIVSQRDSKATRQPGLIRQIVNILWGGDDHRKEGAFFWAIEANARDVIRFIIAWTLMDRLSTMLEDSEIGGIIQSMATKKYSLMSWINELGASLDRCDLDCLELYPSFRSHRYTLQAIVDCLIAPHMVYFSDVQKSLGQIWSKLESHNAVQPLLDAHRQSRETESGGDDFSFVDCQNSDLEEQGCDEGWEVLSNASTVFSL